MGARLRNCVSSPPSLHPSTTRGRLPEHACGQVAGLVLKSTRAISLIRPLAKPHHSEPPIADGICRTKDAAIDCSATRFESKHCPCEGRRGGELDNNFELGRAPN